MRIVLLLFLVIALQISTASITLFSSQTRTHSWCHHSLQDILWNQNGHVCRYHICVNIGNGGRNLSISSTVAGDLTYSNLCMDIDYVNGKYDSLLFQNVLFYFDSSVQMKALGSVEFYNCKIILLQTLYSIKWSLRMYSMLSLSVQQ